MGLERLSRDLHPTNSHRERRVGKRIKRQMSFPLAIANFYLLLLPAITHGGCLAEPCKGSLRVRDLRRADANNVTEQGITKGGFSDVMERVHAEQAETLTRVTGQLAGLKDKKDRMAALVSQLEQSNRDLLDKIQALEDANKLLEEWKKDLVERMQALVNPVEFDDLGRERRGRHLANVNQAIRNLRRRVALLENSLQCVSKESSEDDLYLDGCNVHIRNKATSTSSINGKGNLILGYSDNECPTCNRTGSHNLVVGPGNSYESYGGIVIGTDNNVSAPYASVLAGFKNTASATYSVAIGGTRNTASGNYSIVAAGEANKASGYASMTAAGELNKADGEYSMTAAGSLNRAGDFYSMVAAGEENTASGYASMTASGRNNTAGGVYAMTAAGISNTATGESSMAAAGFRNSVRGIGAMSAAGDLNVADGDSSLTAAGSFNRATEFYTVVAAGEFNTASGYASMTASGLRNTAAGDYSTTAAGSDNTAVLNNAFVGGD